MQVYVDRAMQGAAAAAFKWRMHGSSGMALGASLSERPDRVLARCRQQLSDVWAASDSFASDPFSARAAHFERPRMAFVDFGPRAVSHASRVFIQRSACCSFSKICSMGS